MLSTSVRSTPLATAPARAKFRRSVPADLRGASGERVVREIRRVLRDPGEVRAMFYGRYSWAAYRRWAYAQLYALKKQRRPPRTLTEAIWSYMESPGTR